MKAKFKKDFIKSFNEKYNYENESLLKEITPKQPILKRRPLCYLSIILITMLLSVSITYVVVRNRLLYDNEDNLYNDMVEFVVTQGKASASLLQRRFKVGYNRAARAIDLLEERGIIGPNNGSKPREVLVKLQEED